MKCIIIDDDLISTKILSGFVKQTDGLELLHEFDDPNKGLNFLLNNKVDFVLLDIDMPEISGIDIIKSLGEKMPFTILTTSHKEFALESHQYNVVGYLVKPFSYSNFISALKKLQNLTSKTSKAIEEVGEHLFVKKDGIIKKLNKKDILYIECIGDYLNIYTSETKYIIHSTIKNISKILPEKDFLKIHRSYIVRIDKIEEIENDAVLISNKQIAIGKTHKQEVYKKLNILH